MPEKTKFNVIGLITDFGTDDNYAGVVKGVIKRMAPGIDIIDISHGVASYSITNAQFYLFSSVAYFPAGTVFYIVVDPSVGSRRRALIAQDSGRLYIAPDNGILDAVLTEGAQVYAVRERMFQNVSATFHGRDIFAPVAAMLAGGVSPGEIGDAVEDRVRVPFPAYSARDTTVEGIVVHIDRFGNVISSIPNEVLRDRPGQCRIAAGAGVFEAVSCITFSDLGKDSVGILPGSSGLVEMAMNRSPLAARYGMKIDDRIKITYA